MSFRSGVSELNDSEEKHVKYRTEVPVSVGTYVTHEEALELIAKDVARRTGLDIDVVMKVRDALENYDYTPF